MSAFRARIGLAIAFRGSIVVKGTELAKLEPALGIRLGLGGPGAQPRQAGGGKDREPFLSRPMRSGDQRGRLCLWNALPLVARPARYADAAVPTATGGHVEIAAVGEAGFRRRDDAQLDSAAFRLERRTESGGCPHGAGNGNPFPAGQSQGRV